MEAPLEIDVTEAARLARLPGNVLLDVREPHERTLCHVPGSVHIPMAEIPGRMGELSSDRQILVLCHHGSRSMRVTEYLRANDYPFVSNIAGGIDAWAETIDPSMARY